jgi:nicotinate phosphoribosyltransferase
MQKSAPIDGFGIGTHMDTSADAPYLDCAYKLVEYGGRARRKRSEGKVLWPGRKQVFRSADESGRMAGDILALEGDEMDGEALIRPVMRRGRRIAPPEPLIESRARALRELKRLPDALKQLQHAPEYPVVVSETLKGLAQQVDTLQAESSAKETQERKAPA